MNSTGTPLFRLQLLQDFLKSTLMLWSIIGVYKINLRLLGHSLVFCIAIGINIRVNLRVTNDCTVHVFIFLEFKKMKFLQFLLENLLYLKL